MTIDIIIPVYNRPAEAEAILDSLAHQSDGGFGVVVVEDGSARDCAAEVERFRDKLHIAYLRKENGGPAAARNFGAAHSRADFFIFFDSDVVVPPGYIATVRRALTGGVEFYGGPDMADPAFSPMQKAVSYSMTSPFTTGGIRGGRRPMERFTPRSFNMGVGRRLFEAVGGFSSDMRYGEDIDFSLRIAEAGGIAETPAPSSATGAAGAESVPARVEPTLRSESKGRSRTLPSREEEDGLLFGRQPKRLAGRSPQPVEDGGMALPGVPGVLLREAGVYHRRRTDMRSFFRQVWHSGAARIDLARRHPRSLRAVHLLPMLFVIGSAACVALAAAGALLTPLWWLFLMPVAAVWLVWLVDSSLRNRSVRVGILSVATSMVQLWGYGTGMITGLLRLR